MILINLLPYREIERQQRLRVFYIGVVVAALVGVGLGVAWLGLVQSSLAEQNERNRYLTAESAKLGNQLKDIEKLKAEIALLEERRDAVEGLQAQRNAPIRLLAELVRIAPEGVYLTSLKEADGAITLAGWAQSNERVSEFLRAIERDAEWLEKAQLIEIKAGTPGAANAGGRSTLSDRRRLFEFSVKASYKKPKAPAAAASAPARAGKAS
jgi:type IV pilus assembly protein PilN